MKRPIRLSRSIYKKLKPISILDRKKGFKPANIEDPFKKNSLPIINKHRTTKSKIVQPHRKRSKVRDPEQYKLTKKFEYSKIIIYTSIYGNYDKLKEQPKFENVEYVCFTDNPLLVHPTWKIIHNNKIMIGRPDVYKAKYFKMKSHELFPDADYTIFIDASIQIRHNNFIQILLNYLGEHDYGIYIHPKRGCIYQEHKILLKSKSQKMKKILPIINKQLEHYGKEGIPQNFGLWACGILIRKNTEYNKKINELWWEEILKWSYRDQLSLPYILWKNNLSIDTIRLNQYADQLFKIHVHSSTGWVSVRSVRRRRTI